MLRGVVKGDSIVVSKSYFFLSTQPFTKKNEKTVKKIFSSCRQLQHFGLIFIRSQRSHGITLTVRKLRPSPTKFRVNRANMLNGLVNKVSSQSFFQLVENSSAVL